MTLRQDQGHQTWYELLDRKQGHDHAKSEKPPLYSVHKKANVRVFVKLENTSIISLKYVQQLTNPTKFQLNRIRTQFFWLKSLEIAVTLKYGQGN